MKLRYLFFFLFTYTVLLVAHPRSYNEHRIIDGSRWGYPARADSLHGFNVYSYDLTLYVDHENEYLQGNVEAIVTAEENLSHIVYELVGLTVDSVLVNNNLTDFTHNEGELEILLPNIQSDETFTTNVYYSGNPILHSNYYTLGMIFLNNCFYTISDPNATRYWMPCYDHPWDKAKIDFHIRTRDDWLVACNGIRTGIEDLDDGTKIHHWEGENPMASYLFSISARNFVEFETTHNGIPLHNFAPADMQSVAEEAYNDLPIMLDAYTAAYGPYPFEKYGNSITNFSTFGAMEHQTMTTLDRSYIGTEYGLDVIAHELSHQWFGNCLTPLTWKDVWLSESFATYSEAIYREARYGFENMVNYITTSHHNYYISWMNANGPRTIYDPIFTETFAPPVYEKGASVLHMLRLKLGDELFFEALQTYLQAYYNSNVVTEEFIAIVEEVSNQDLTQFFQQWIFEDGVPSLEYAIFTDESVNEVLLSAQTTSNTNTDFYLDIPLYFSSQTDSVLITASPEFPTYSILDYNSGDHISIDPNQWLLLKQKNRYRPTLNFAYAADGLVALFWSESNEIHNIEGYHIYRSTEENGTYERLTDEAVTTFYYEDVEVENNISYYYKIKAVTQTRFYSEFSEALQANPIHFELDNGILVVDDSDSMSTEQETEIDLFYETVIPSSISTYDIADSGNPTIELLSQYSTVIWHDDDLNYHNIDNHIPVIGPYILGGGKLILAGWKTINSMNTSFRENILGITELTMVNAPIFESAESETLPAMQVDTDKLLEMWETGLPFTSIFQNADGIYTFNSTTDESYNNFANAVEKNIGNDGKIVVFGFPLYYMEENQVRAFFAEKLEEYNEVSEDNYIPTVVEATIKANIFPNPFSLKSTSRGEIKIKFELPEEQVVSFQVYNIMGQKIYGDEARFFSKGIHTKSWNGKANNGSLVPSGVYFFKIKGSKQISVKKFVIVD